MSCDGQRNKGIPAIPAKLLHQGVNLRSIENLLLEEFFRNLMKEMEIVPQDILCPQIALDYNAPDLGINLNGSALRIILLLGKISPEKDLFLFLAEGHRPQFFTHPPLTNHPVGKLRSFLNIVARAGRHTVQDQFLRYPTAEENREIIEQVLLGIGMLFVNRQLLGESQRHPAGENRNFVDRVGAREEVGNQGTH